DFLTVPLVWLVSRWFLLGHLYPFHVRRFARTLICKPYRPKERHFSARHAFSDAAKKIIVRYHVPGNDPEEM
ncbi:MAG: hypothetical protein ACU843_13485, partial [Gammaproteobacteria bacterium]